MKRGTRAAIHSGKNPVKKRMEAIEKATGQGIDLFAKDIRELFNNEQMMADAMDQLDILVGALAMIIEHRFGVSQDEIKQACRVVKNEKDRVRQQLERQQLEQVVRGQAERDLEAAIGGPVSQDLVNLAVATGEDGYPDRAFIFGG